ncbi:malate dehydrogenase [Alkalihalophilus pseudofirmus]|nr:malate dehydrogenase [Alkalihalophilus pseudofirmus]
MIPTKFDWKKLQSFCTDVFKAAGVPVKSAEIVAESLVEADLRGVDSHGVVRTSIYLKRMEEGMIQPDSNFFTHSETDTMALLDGNNNFGSVVGMEALNKALDKAEKSGIGVVGVKNSNHFGTGAYYAKKAIDQGFILLVLSNASQTMPPTGGVRPFLGTNPLAIGVPTGTDVPFILDMATSVVARGKIIVASQKGESIPEGWAIDKEGNPTTDANAALEGSVLPLGGPKGYGISMFIDILAGVLTGAGFGKYVNNMYENWEDPQNVGHFFLAININNFMPIDYFKERMDLYIADLKNEPKALGVEEIYIPGELELRRTIERKENGIELPEKVVQELSEIGQKYGIDFTKAAYTTNISTEVSK